MIVLSQQKFNNKQEVLNELHQKSVLAFDTESSEDRLLGVALAWSPQDSAFLSADEIPSVLNLLSRGKFIAHNVLYDIPLLNSKYNINIQYIFDTMLAAQSLGYPAALGDLSIPFNFSHRYITDLLYDDAGMKMKKEIPAKTKKGTRKVDITLSDVKIEDIATICCGHAMATYKIWDALKDKVPAAYSLDMELIPLLMWMHTNGIRVNTELAQERHRKLNEEIEYLRGLCEGMGFNPASPKQIGLALSHAGFMTYFSRTGQMVTDEEALRPLMNKTSIVPLVLRYRDKVKLNSTYIKPLVNIERVYPKYHIVRTGRFASSPNIQNIPEEQRDLYLPDEGDFFWDADAHQIEPVLMAYFSGDKKMIEDIATGDIYQPVADRYKIARYTAKQLVLAGSYEGGAETLVETAHRKGDTISLEDAQMLLNQYYRDYRRFKQWKDEVRKDAQNKGYVLTLLGRKRTLESMAEGEEFDYDPLLKAVNTVIQGSAADILKLAMKRLQHNKVSATVHDEILLSTAENISADILNNLCSIPVRWDVKTGQNWGEMK